MVGLVLVVLALLLPGGVSRRGWLYCLARAQFLVRLALLVGAVRQAPRCSSAPPPCSTSGLSTR